MPPFETEHDQPIADKILAAFSLAGRGGRLLRIAIGSGLVLAAALARFLLAPVWGTHYTFLTFAPALLLAAILGGLEGGLVATALTGCLVKSLWLTPSGFFSTSESDWWALATFMSAGVLVSGIVDSKQRADARAHAAEMRAVINRDRLENENTFRESEEHFRRLAGATFEGIVISQDGIIVDANEAFSKMIGYELDEILGQKAWRFADSADQPTVEGIIRDGKEAWIEHSMVHKDGHPIFVETHGQTTEYKNQVLRFSAIRDITERRKAERLTFDAHQRLKTLLQALPVGVHFSNDISCQFIDGNKAALAQFESVEGDNISASAVDDRVPGRRAKFFIGDRQITASEMPIQRAIAENHAVAPFEMTVELPSGRTWLAEASAAPIHDQRGNVISAVAVMVDITERKRVEEALRHIERLNLAQEERSKLSGRLIEAQEKERARIARELHDDICQQLAFLSIQLDQLRLRTRLPANGEPERRRSESDRLEKLNQALDTCREIGKNVQTLSHEIHSSKLDYIGLVLAVSGFCKEFSAKNQVEVRFSTQDVPGTLSKDASLCIFRIVQEALRNGVKHSGATCFEVSLRGERGGIELKVSDRGVGFDPQQTQAKRGLGLVSIQERVNLVNGAVSIESEPNQGTTIRAWIPVAPMPTPVRELTASQIQ